MDNAIYGNSDSKFPNLHNPFNSARPSIDHATESEYVKKEVDLQEKKFNIALL